MGCASSKEDGFVISIPPATAAQSRSAAPELKEHTENFESFNMIEQSDEKSLQAADKVLANMTARLSISSLEEEPDDDEWTIEDKIRYMRSLLEEMRTIEEEMEESPPMPSDAAVWNKWAALDSPTLPPTAAFDVMDTLLVPHCPPLPKRLVYRVILAEIEQLAKNGGGVVDVSPPKSDDERLIIVGDTHGQLQDALHILLTHGKPSATNRYIFNGDIADRGPNACEIFVLVLLFNVCCPGSVVVTRGNHEARDINERPASSGGGFRDEVLTKYDDDTFELFQLLFNHLPVAAVVGTQIMVIHGGLSRERADPLAALRRMKHKIDVPQRPGSAAETLLFDSLWSDPMEDDGIQSGGRGDDTIKWGPDVTDEFLEASGLQLVVRSHQVPPGRRGFGLHHGARVITVFSASNYAGVCMNRGGVLIVPATGAVSIEEHMAASLEDLRKATDEAIKSEMKLRALKMQSPTMKRLKTMERNMIKGWHSRAQANAERRQAKLKDELLKRVTMEVHEVERSLGGFVDSLLSTVRARVCQRRATLRAALTRRHTMLVHMGRASKGGGLLPLDMFREELAEALDLRIDWDALPERFQTSLAKVITEPSAGASVLSPELYPAVRFEAFIERFHVEMRDPSMAGKRESAPDTAPDTLLSLVHAQSLPLRKALSLVAQKEKTPPITDAEAGRWKKMAVHTSHAKTAVVSRGDFVAAVEALVGAMAENEGDSPREAHELIAHTQVLTLAEAAPKDELGRILFHQLLDSLVVHDVEAPTIQSI